MKIGPTTCTCQSFICSTGSSTQDEEAPAKPTRPSHFVQRKVNRHNRTKPTPRTTTAASADDDDGDVKTMSNCPEPYGFFADAEQCDKYYACVDGDMSERLCPDGMVFNDYSSSEEKCDLPYNIDCSKRSKLRELLCMGASWQARELRRTTEWLHYYLIGKHFHVPCNNALYW